jgi:nitrate reductase (cytochrome), electron transfer subunit
MKALLNIILSATLVISFSLFPRHALTDEMQGNTSQQLQNTSINEEELGLRKVTLYNERDIVPPGTAYSSVDPGESELYERAYENAPPMIPHSVADLLPITTEFNACIECHMPDEAEDMGSTPIPQSHLVNLRTQQDLGGKLYQGRFFCSQCHAPQTQLNLVVENDFKAEFRREKDHFSSRLIENMNEGIEEEEE